MSGWIKFWKDMPNDPRVFAAAQKLSERYVLAGRSPGGGIDLSSNAVCNAWRNAVTGALVTLWVYADEHIRDDDTLDLTSQTLDAMVGLEGFFDAIPRDWVDELDDGRIILPGYCEKNMLIAKRKRTVKSNARVTRWRRNKKQARNAVGNAVTPRHVTEFNRAGDLDQDLDQDLQEGRGKGSSNLKGLRDKGEKVFTKSAALAPPQNGKHDPRSFEVIKSNVLAIAQQFKTSDPEKLYKFGHNAYRLSRDQCRAAAKQLREDGEFDRLQIAL